MQEFFDTVDSTFDERQLPLHQKQQIFDIIPTLTNIDRLFFKFLYGNAPFQDIDSQSPEFFLKVAQHTANIRDESIPIQVYLNYVAMPRVNNEFLEYYHEYFSELYGQVKNLPFKEKVQKINLYCYQLATYQGSDLRTLGPLHMAKSTLGRCGEESTLLVSALRACGVPARQVYVPRWAHCDDNHAWVEVFGDRRWWYTGACEPQPVLNLGWFNYASSRAPLVHTRAFSVFDCAEQVISKSNGVIYLNVTQRYAQLSQLDIQVSNNSAIDEYKIRFQLVNAGELFTLFEKESDYPEISVFLAKGEYVVELLINGKVQQKVVKLVQGQSKVIFDVSQGNLLLDGTFDLAPPFGNYDCEPEVDAEIKAKFDQELKVREEIRLKYKEQTVQQIAELEVAEEFRPILQKSLGNYAELYKFIKDEAFSDALKLGLLESLSDKDLFDVKYQVLVDWLTTVKEYESLPHFDKYILPRRVFHEPLTACAGAIAQILGAEKTQQFKENPEELMKHLCAFDDVEQALYSDCYSTVEGCLNARRGTWLTRSVAFVTVCRVLGVPSYYDPAYQEAWYLPNGAEFFKIPNCEVKYVKVKVDNSKNVQFSFAKKDETTNCYVNLNLDYISNFQVAPNIYEIVIPSGSYRVLETNRYSNGTTTSRATYRDFEADSSIVIDSVELNITKLEIKVCEVSENIVSLNTGKQLKDLVQGKVILALIDVGAEPTQHLLHELHTIREPVYEVALLLKDVSKQSNELVQKVVAKYGKVHLFTEEVALNTALLKCIEAASCQYPVVLSLDAGVITHHQQGYCVGSVDHAILYL